MIDLEIDFPAFRSLGDAHLEIRRGEPQRLPRTTDEAQAGLSGSAPPFSLIAGFACRYDVFPAGLAALDHGYDVVEGQLRFGESVAAVLANVIVSEEDIDSREADDLLLLGQGDIVQEPEHRWHLDREADSSDLSVGFLDHFDFALKKQLDGALPTYHMEGLK